jgi:hypothetical protein
MVCMSKKPAPKADEPALMKRVNHFMPVPMVEGLTAVAQRKGGTASDHLRKAVRQYLKRHGTAV